jgi:hypothetical protein
MGNNFVLGGGAVRWVGEPRKISFFHFYFFKILKKKKLLFPNNV